MIINEDTLKSYIEKFNYEDNETIVQYIDNASACSWLFKNIPMFECPDKKMEEVYYFRWWVYRKHIKDTVDGFVITEFHQNVPWAGKHNTIVCPVGHQLYEGRWISDSRYIEDYIRFWYKNGGDLRSYSSWLGEAIWQYCTVKGDFSLAVELLDDFIVDYEAWEKSNLHETGLFWSIDDRDGGEFSISGSGLRPTLNGYMYGYAKTIAKTAKLVGRTDICHDYEKKANNLKELIRIKLWDEKEGFFKVIPLDSKEGHLNNWSFEKISSARNVKELLGYIPWYFNLPNEMQSSAWLELMETDGFYAPYGPTTAEQRHQSFMAEHEHECLWNGPSWPFATSQMLTAMANLLSNFNQKHLTKKDYFEILKIYADCHQHTTVEGKRVNWVDENLDPFTGEWLSRVILENWGWRSEKGGYERGKDYNHSTFCDLIITGLVGLRPNEGDFIEINPLIPEDWDYFCLENVCYHGIRLTILYDRSGKKYGRGKGIQVLSNGINITDSKGCMV